MEKFGSVDALLDFAIGEEEKAARFYGDLAKTVKSPLGQIFLDFAKEEVGHKEKLLQVKAGKRFEPVAGKVADLKIADYVVEVGPAEKLDYQKALVIAMKKEKAAFRLYMDLHEAAQEPDLRNVMLALAQEEAKHKLRFEIEYDDNVLKEN